MAGTEFEVVNGIFPGKQEHNVPCAVCYSSIKTVKLMIPARITCPSSWTREYKGYLMAEFLVLKRMQSMSVLMKILSLLLADLLIQVVLYSISQYQPVMVYLVHLMLTIELLLVLCVPSNNGQFL